MPRLGGNHAVQSRLVGSETQVLSASVSSPAAQRNQGLTIAPSPTHAVVTPEATPSSVARQRWMASESGSGSLLPDFKSNSAIGHCNTFGSNSQSSFSISRQRTFSSTSSPVPAAVPVTAPSSPVESNNNILRRRSTLSIDQADVQTLSRSILSSSVSNDYQYADIDTNDPSKFRRHAPVTYQMMNYQGWTLGHLVQTLAVMTIFYLVFDAHSKVSEASLRLQHYRKEESILVNQMDRVEGRAMQLQDQLKRLREDSLTMDGSQSNTLAEAIQLSKDIVAVKRTHTEVGREVHALQEFLQHQARQELADRYGTDGVIQVNMDLGFFTEGPNTIVIELFDETPHANWVWLQQIMQGDWKGSKFIWHPAHMLLASQAAAAHTNLEFVESSFHKPPIVDSGTDTQRPWVVQFLYQFVGQRQYA